MFQETEDPTDTDPGNGFAKRTLETSFVVVALSRQTYAVPNGTFEDFVKTNGVLLTHAKVTELNLVADTQSRSFFSALIGAKL